MENMENMEVFDIFLRLEKSRRKRKQSKNKFEKKLENFLYDFVAEYQEKNQDWVSRLSFKILHQILCDIKTYRENCVIIQYSIEVDWKRLQKSTLSSSLSPVFSILPDNIKNLRDIDKAINEGINKATVLILFRHFSNDIVFLVRDGLSQAYLPQDIIEQLKKARAEDHENIIKKASSRRFVLSLKISEKAIELLEKEVEKGAITREELNQHIDKIQKMKQNQSEEYDYILLTFSALVVDVDEKTAFYPVTIELNFSSLSSFPFRDPVLKRNLLDALYDYILNKVKEAKDELDNSEKLPEKVYTSLQQEAETFAMPSSPFMLTLLAIFAGRPERIPRHLLHKPKDERTPEEKELIEEYLSSVFEQPAKKNRIFDNKGQIVITETITAIVADNPKIKATAEIGTSLLKDDLIFQEESLAYYIKKTYRAEGLRHLLGILIGLDEAGRSGRFVWNINEHLQRLGYKKKLSRVYSNDLKETALEIVKIFTSLFLTVSSNDETGTGQTTGKRLFFIEGFEKTYKNHWVIDEKLTIKATDWYTDAFQSTPDISARYTKLLKNVARENHKNHALTIYLAPLFAVFWRINSEGREFSLKSLLEWCNIDLSKNPTHKTRIIKNLESELDYMQQRGYLGAWINKATGKPQLDINTPLDAVLVFSPPDWLRDEITLIAKKKEKYLDKKTNMETAKQTLTKEELKETIEKSRLTQRQFANKINISPALLSLYLKGRRKISQTFAQKIQALFLNDLNDLND